MERSGIDCWILVGREYNEDPVMATMLPATWMHARRRTILVFLDSGGRRLALSRYAIGRGFPAGWDPLAEPDQWAALGTLLASEQPKRIAIDRSSIFALADGLTSTEYEALLAALPADLVGRLCPATDLAVGWLETRIPAEIEAFVALCSGPTGCLGRRCRRG